MKKINMNRKVLLQVLMTALLLLGIGSKSYAQFLVNESFRNKVAASGNAIEYGGTPRAYFTADLGGDPEGEGWFRLTSDATNQKGYFFVNNPFPSAGGVFIDFEYKTWRTKIEGNSGYTDGDGIGFFLFDAEITPQTFSLGGYGGSLGYAPMQSGSLKTRGLKGGYIGLGLDEFGNYSTNADGKEGESTGNVERKFKNYVALRGKTAYYDSDYNTHLKNSNLVLAKEKLNIRDNNSTYGDIGYTTVVPKRPSDQTFYRRVQIEIQKEVVTKQEFKGGFRSRDVGKFDNGYKIEKHTINGSTQYGYYFDVTKDGYTIKVRMAVRPNGQFYEVLNYHYEEAPPAELKMGFAGSTGGAINYHEIRNLFATTPGGVVVEKTVDKAIANVGDDLTYTINLKGQNVETLKFQLNDDLAAIRDYFEVTSITATNNGHTGTSVVIPANSTTLNNIDVTLSRLATATITIKGKVKKAPQNTLLKNTATIVKSSILPAKVRDLVVDAQLTSTASTQIIDPNYCGCPEGAIEMTRSTTKLLNGKVYCVSNDLEINSLQIEEGASLYVQTGVKLKTNGNFIQTGGVVSICPYGAIEHNGSVSLGSGSRGGAKVIMKDYSSFTITGALMQYEPRDGQVIIEMNDHAVLEVCSTYNQQATYPVVNYVGDGDPAYFIGKAEISGSGGQSKLANSNNIYVVAMKTVTGLAPGTTNYSGENASGTHRFLPPGYDNSLACGNLDYLYVPKLEVKKVGVANQEVEGTNGNGEIIYTFEIKNTGNIPITLNSFTDSKIPNFSPVYEQISADSILKIGETWIAKATYNITDGDIDTEVVKNTATVEGVSIKGKPVTAEGKAETPVEGGGPLITNPHIYHKVQ